MMVPPLFVGMVFRGLNKEFLLVITTRQSPLAPDATEPQGGTVSDLIMSGEGALLANMQPHDLAIIY
jgi:hypothetical protein